MPLNTIKNMAKKGKIAVKKVGFWGLKASFWVLKNTSWQPK